MARGCLGAEQQLACEIWLTPFPARRIGGHFLMRGGCAQCVQFDQSVRYMTLNEPRRSWLFAAMPTLQPDKHAAERVSHDPRFAGKAQCGDRYVRPRAKRTPDLCYLP